MRHTIPVGTRVLWERKCCLPVFGRVTRHLCMQGSCLVVKCESDPHPLLGKEIALPEHWLQVVNAPEGWTP